MKHIRTIAVPAYVVAAILVSFSLMELGQAILPLRVGNVVWRVGAMGLLSRTLITPILGLLLAYCVALLTEQARVLRALAVVSAVVGALLLLGMAAYSLDAVQMRSLVAPETKTPYSWALMASFVKFGATLCLFGVVARSGWRTSSLMKRGAASAKHTPVVVRQPFRAAAPSAGEGEVAAAEAMSGV